MTAAQPLDANYRTYTADLYDPVTGQFVAQQSSTTATASDGTKYAMQSVNTAQVGGIATQLDANNYQYISLGTRIAGEDIPNDTLKVEQRGSYTIISTNTTTVVKNTPGFLYTITVGDPGSAWVLTCYDNTSASGTPFILKPTVSGSYTFNFSFITGLTIVTSGVTAGNAVVSSR